MEFERLKVWQRSKVLAVDVFKGLEPCRDFGFRDQVRRSVLSVPSNIAEGMERRGSREKAQFLWIAKASCGELRTQLLIGLELGYLADEPGRQWITETRELSKMLAGLIKAISD
ncbi:four helix bundle protein [Pseudomonas sp. KNUC1026]|uniref:four helix bundle protein n=1 Tax=Pseudomonas sp. KNUC1026 TaxID=2893890 RepID=UPI001F3B2359|nr:four helix bundle protein [Pseudomonas sp. KNUC1026]UFH48552.1 four helix bundle protein [Pseudomonas sp. KNUC1026]